MKRLIWSGLAGFLIGLLILAWGWRQWRGAGPPGPGGQQTVRVRVARGMTMSAAADTLVARGLVAHRRTLLVGARLTGQDRRLRAGLFELAYGRSPAQLLQDLTSGPSVQVVVTIPEGLDSVEIARVVARSLGLSPDGFLAVADSLAAQAVRAGHMFSSAGALAAHDSLLSRQVGPPTGRRFHWSEGLMAPDTYHFAEGSKANTVVAVLLDSQLVRLRLATDEAVGGINGALAPFDLLTLASVIESEARRNDERRRIAAVYTNRLGKGWRLEADPTVAYVLDKKGRRLFYKDLRVDSPYNTYRHKGLPPGPIGTPGLASLRAAARPDSTCRAMYFVSDGADGHVFSRTAREHEAAVKRFRAVRARQRR